MTGTNKFTNKGLLRCAKTCISLLLAFVCIISDVQFVFAQAFSANPEWKLSIGSLAAGTNNSQVKTHKNTYVLSVATGATAGDRVLFFAVKYIDDKNVIRTHYIILSDNELQTMYSGVANGEASYNLSKNNSQTVKQRIKQVKATTGYSIPDDGSYIGNNVKPLRSMSNDTVLFKTENAIKEVLEINFFGSTGTRENYELEHKTGVSAGKNVWTCNDLRLYEVDRLYGMDMYGYYSNKYFLKFEGTELAAMETLDGKNNFSWSVDSINKVKQEKVSGVSLKTGQNIKYSNANPNKVYFEMGFNDDADAGIEALITSSVEGEKTIAGMGVADSIVLTVEYFDTFGDMRRVELPFISSAAAWAAANLSKPDESIIGLAQQGEALGFVATLPDFKSLYKYKIDYGNKVIGEIGIKVSESAQATARLAKQESTNDSIGISYLTAYYDADKAAPKAQVINGSLKCSASNGLPTMYYKQKEDTVAFNGSIIRDFKPFRAGTELESRDYSNTYMVSISTDKVLSAGTTNDITMQLGYTDISGVFRYTEAYNLRDLVKGFYGYWPGGGADIAYQASLAANVDLKVLITLNDVEAFESVSLTNSGKNEDDWQIKNFNISKVNSVSKRGVVWEKLTLGKSNTDRRFYRDVVSELVVNNDSKVFIKGTGETKEISLVSKNVTEVEDSNWLDDRYSMTFEQANKNLGFTKTRHYYTLSVDVGNDSNISMSNDDCGSQNLFYFQLVFKGGRSSYVLANQLITSDGFRAGATESFTISTNQNYGELVSVNIIPDDMSSSSSVYDKLKIDKITVTKDSTGGLSKQWIVNNVGWISIDYRDEGESHKKTGRPARSEAEMTRSFAVTSSAFVMNFLFSVTTAINSDYVEFDEAAKDTMDDANRVYDAKGVLKGRQFAQFKGTMMAELKYYNAAGEFKKYTFDVIEAMYKYAYVSAKYKAPENVEFPSKKGYPAISDTNFMFRPNHTDRFVISLGDVSEIEYIDFLPTAEGTTTWFIENVTVSLIDSEGVLGFNENDEYERSGQSTVVAESVPFDEVTGVITTINTQQQVPIEFLNNKIEIKQIDDEVWSPAITREPATTNDTLNVYIYTKKQESSFKLKSVLKYKDRRDISNQIASGDMRKMEDKSTGGFIYYAIGLSANNLSTLNELVVQADSASTLDNYVSMAVVQRIRAGVMISSYRFKFDTHSSAMDLVATPIVTSNDEFETETQVVTIKLGQNMTKENLIAANRDLAVAINYTTSTMDGRATTYDSTYVYATDEKINSLSPGDTITINVRQPFMQEIKGLKLVATGGLKLPVESAYVATYVSSKNTGNVNKLTGWYSFDYDKNEFITGNSGTIAPSANGLNSENAYTTVDIKLEGNTPITIQENGEIQRLDANPLRITVAYRNTHNLLQEITFDDIRMHKHAVTSSSKAVVTDTAADAATDSKDTASPAPTPTPQIVDELLGTFMIKDLKDIRSIKIEPYDSKLENTVNINLKSLNITVKGPQGDTNINYPITGGNKRVTEGSPLNLGIANISASIKGQYYSLETKKATDFKATNESISITTMGGKKVNFSAAVTGSLNKDDLVVSCTKVVDKAQINNNSLLERDAEGKYTFNTPLNLTSEDMVFEIIASSKENASSVAKLIITVPKEAEIPDNPVLNFYVKANELVYVDDPAAEMQVEINYLDKENVLNIAKAKAEKVLVDDTVFYYIKDLPAKNFMLFKDLKITYKQTPAGTEQTGAFAMPYIEYVDENGYLIAKHTVENWTYGLATASESWTIDLKTQVPFDNKSILKYYLSNSKPIQNPTP